MGVAQNGNKMLDRLDGRSAEANAKTSTRPAAAAPKTARMIVRPCFGEA